MNFAILEDLVKTKTRVSCVLQTARLCLSHPMASTLIIPLLVMKKLRSGNGMTSQVFAESPCSVTCIFFVVPAVQFCRATRCTSVSPRTISLTRVRLQEMSDTAFLVGASFFKALKMGAVLINLLATSLAPPPLASSSLKIQSLRSTPSVPFRAMLITCRRGGLSVLLTETGNAYLQLICSLRYKYRVEYS